jgi:hypothetical protein
MRESLIPVKAVLAIRLKGAKKVVKAVGDGPIRTKKMEGGFVVSINGIKERITLVAAETP